MRFSELDGASVGVWGAGREIASFADQLARRLPSARIAVAVFDAPAQADVRETLRSPAARILVRDGDRPGAVAAALSGCDVVVRSPGVSIYRPELQAVLATGTPVTTATSLWLADRGGAGVLGVTGTKGKSTTAALALHLARAAGLTAQLAGNIGVPALDLLDRDAAEVTVLELSSYHTADLEIGPEVALVTNLYREHTDWHGSEQAYRADKLRLLGLPGVRVAVLSARDERPVESAAELEVLRFGLPGGWDATAGGIALRGELQARSDELPLRGEHNVLNLCAALTALEALGVEPAPLPGALDGFRALPHRLETVAERDRVEWVNDSISTTPESALAALASFPGRELLLIAGGQDRGQDYRRLADALAAAGATVIGVPTTGPRLVAAARSAGIASSRAIDAPDLVAAVELARSLATAGSAVLLSPAAPSFDNYRDFEERGERFRALAAGAASSDR
ncbi:MAG TPA: UDP-N-acetylmuramoyl-L-alanine--D-glutamate ligase [Solirubrobacteraceae bacterium]|nr:UDP-N-acetylmuramoyl-L-alanine--D-glutamate ligase [Solirubrobacteraceae bacterium]